MHQTTLTDATSHAEQLSLGLVDVSANFHALTQHFHAQVDLSRQVQENSAAVCNANQRIAAASAAANH